MTEPTSEVLASRPTMVLLKEIACHFSCRLDDDKGVLAKVEWEDEFGEIQTGDYEVLDRVKKLIAKRDGLATELAERLAKLNKE